MLLEMLDQVTRLGEPLEADVTLVVLLACVYQAVNFEIARSCERLLAQVAGEGSVARVDA